MGEAWQVRAVLQLAEQFGQRLMQTRTAVFAQGIDALEGGVIEADQFETGAQQACAVVLHRLLLRIEAADDKPVLIAAQR
ncbi:hypothetical protein D3C76_1177650 [compost metagenome]